MYQQMETQNGQISFYAPRLTKEDVLRIETIAEEMRAKLIHNTAPGDAARSVDPKPLAQTIYSGLEVTRLWLNRSRSRAQLANMDSRMLADIGITGLQASQECRKWFWQA